MVSTKRIVALLLIAMLAVPAFACFGGVGAVADGGDVVRNGLIAYYNGTMNTRSGHVADSTVWEDLAGSNDITVQKNDSNYFTDSAFHLSGTQYNFPASVLDCVNADEFTVELQIGEIYSTGSSYSTMINSSSNDNFALFLRTNGDYLEFKSKSNARPKVSGGRELAENSTIAITFSLSERMCIMYVDGHPVGSSAISSSIDARGSLFFGHDEASKKHTADYVSMRFYSRALTSDEVAQNSVVDGTFDYDYVPEKTYTHVAQNATNIVGGIALSRKINSMDEYNTLCASETLPAVAIFNINSSMKILDSDGNEFSGLDVDTLWDSEIASKVILAFYVKDSEAAEAIAAKGKEKEFSDFYVMSDDAELVKSARKKYNLCRGIIDMTGEYNGKTTLSDAEISSIRKKASSSLARVVVLPSSISDKETIDKLSKLELTPWIEDTASTLDKTQALNLLLSSAYGIISDDTAALCDAATTVLDNNTMVRMPVNVGHRGIPSRYATVPENTLESAIAAYNAGANAIELDIWVTNDDVLVIHHDSSTSSPSMDRTFAIEQHSYAEVSELYYTGYYNTDENGEYTLDENGNKTVYTGFHIPTLEAYLKEFKGKDVQLVIEIKSGRANVISLMKDLIDEYDMYLQCSVITFPRTNQFNRMMSDYSEMPLGYLGDANTNLIDSAAAAKIALETVQPFGATLHPDYDGYTKSVTTAATYRGLTIWTWTYDSVADVYNHLLLGHAGLTSNYANALGSLAREFSATALTSGNTTSIKATAMNYKRETSDITDAKITVIDGEELVESIDGLTVKYKDGVTGEVSLIVSYTQVFDVNKSYTLYEQPISVSVTGDSQGDDYTDTDTDTDDDDDDDADQSDGEKGLSTGAIIAICAGAAVIVAGATAAAIIISKRRQQ